MLVPVMHAVLVPGRQCPQGCLKRMPKARTLCAVEPDLTTLALGTDLTTLGLNLNSTESLWKTFASPWADGPSKPDPEFKVRVDRVKNTA